MDYATLLTSACTLIRQTIWEALQSDPAAQALVPSLEDIVVASPAGQLLPNGRLSLWLYRVTLDESIKNRPPIRRGVPRVEGTPPGSDLDLWLLITPFAQTGPDNTFLLGKVMQALADHPIIIDSSTRLKVFLAPIDMAEHLHLWEAIQMPYRLSAVYCVRTG